MNTSFAQLHCLLGFGVKHESCLHLRSLSGSFWLGFQGPGSLQISMAEAPSPRCVKILSSKLAPRKGSESELS